MAKKHPSYLLIFFYFFFKGVSALFFLLCANVPLVCSVQKEQPCSFCHGLRPAVERIIDFKGSTRRLYRFMVPLYY